jgi:hypothetical protein
MPPLLDRPTTLPLGNHVDILFDTARVRGVPDDTLTIRGYLAANRDDAVAIHPTLDVAAVAVGGGSGDYIAGLLGENTSAHIQPGEQVWVVGVSVPPGAYRDAFPVTAVADQGG